ncbi:MAG: hypothetical protein ACREPU_10280, partial [Rhodanobacteraceae bacterium]
PRHGLAWIRANPTHSISGHPGAGRGPVEFGIPALSRDSSSLDAGLRRHDGHGRKEPPLLLAVLLWGWLMGIGVFLVKLVI